MVDDIVRFAVRKEKNKLNFKTLQFFTVYDMLSYKLFSKQFMTSAFRLVLCRLKDKRFSLSEVRQKILYKNHT